MTEEQELVELVARLPALGGQAFTPQYAKQYPTPVLAIGRPGETDLPLGAARFYARDDIWEKTIEDIEPLCSLVVWTTGRTNSLLWEIKRVIQTNTPHRLIIWLHVHIGGWTPERRKVEWIDFLDAYRDVFPKPLPRDVEETQFIGFNDDWTPVAIPAGGRFAGAFGSRLAALEKFLQTQLANGRL